jgi:hypothetical protein
MLLAELESWVQNREKLNVSVVKLTINESLAIDRVKWKLNFLHSV